MKLLQKGVTMEPKMVDPKDFKEKQQDLTELNGDGNRTRGRYGEDLDNNGVVHDKCGTPDCCGTCDTADVKNG
jgi:hypothetical protein